MYSDYLNKTAGCTGATFRVAVLKTVGDRLLTGKSVESRQEDAIERVTWCHLYH